MKIKLSSVQINVVEELSKDGAYLIESDSYHWSKVWQNNICLIMSIHKPTVNFLKKHNIIELIEGTKNRYKIKETYKKQM